MFEAINRYIAQCAVFTPEEISYFNSLLQFKKVRKKTLLLKEGEICNFEAFINKGCIRNYYIDENGTEVTLQFAIDTLSAKNAFGLTNHNWYNNLSWREYLNNGWKMDLGASYSTNLDNLGQQVQNAYNQPKSFPDSVFWMKGKQFAIDQNQQLSQIKAVFDKKLGGISSIRFGSEYWYSYNDQHYRSPLYNVDSLYKFRDHYNAVFVESDIFLTNELAAKLGTSRAEHIPP